MGRKRGEGCVMVMVRFVLVNDDEIWWSGELVKRIDGV